ncbi:condensin complex subunit 3-like [Penaeus indicus]|uniref:condensin complex subunit 3-like n=1 Tax=Penaeus indicus TaxID=29960 RepID=UPI00300C7261
MVTTKQAFADCQRTAASHPKLVKHLTRTYLKSDFEYFLSEFTCLLKKSLIYGDKQPAVERTLNFVAKFATSKKSETEENGKEEKAKEDNDEEQEEEPEEADPFLVKLIQFLLNNHEANSQAVRFRVCQLINKILNHMGEEAVIDDELYSNIYDTMLHRLQDKVPSVRVQAVLALARLQDPRNKECPVIKAYRYHLSMDPNSDVRRAVLTSIAITFQTLPDILERTRDVRDLVRRQAFEVISRKVHLKSLTIAQRVRLIAEGLTDRSDVVRGAVEKNLIQSWLRMVNGNVLDLLSCLDVETAVKEAELALQSMFRDVPYADLIENLGLNKETRTLESGELRPESALYWRCLAEYLRKEGAEDALELLLPELTHFCSYVNNFVMVEVMDDGDTQETLVRCMEREFITTQLVSIIMLYDLSDEVGRRTLDQLVRRLLVSDKVGETLVKGLVEVFGKLHPATTRVNQLAEIISEIREPVTRTEQQERPLSDEEQRKRKLEAARVKVKINQLREEVEECVRSLDLERAQALKKELEELEKESSVIDLNFSTSEEVIQEERTDPTTLSKCLMIVSHMIENPDIIVMNPTLYSLHENLVLPCLRSEDPAVRNQAVRALGLLCLISEELSCQHLILFMQIARIDIEQIQHSALRCAIDLIHLYGLEKFTEAAEDICDITGIPSSPKEKEKEKEKEKDSKDGIVSEEEGGAIISALCQMMDSENAEVRTTAAEGLCKLLLACRITSAKLLSHLVLMWYNPITEDDSLLRHMLGVFFPLYASYGGTNQESLCAAVLPTLQTLFNAPTRSPLADVDVEDVANFLVSITSPSIIADRSNEQVNNHDILVFTLCSEILAYPESSWNKLLIRCLNNLSLSPTNYSTLRQVDVLAMKLLKRVKERVCINGLERFQQTVQNLLKDAPETEVTIKEEKPDNTTITEDLSETTGINGLERFQQTVQNLLKDAPETEVTIKEEKPDNTTITEDLSETTEMNTPGNKSIENTFMKRKRMLYNTTTFSDPEMFSSEPESDCEASPSKRIPQVPDLVLPGELSDVGSPKLASTQKDEGDSKEEENSRVANLVSAEDGEVELTFTSEKKEKDGSSSDLFDSSDGTPKQPTRRCRAPGSPDLGKAAKIARSSVSSRGTDDEDTPPRSSRRQSRKKEVSPTTDTSPALRGRRRNKKETTTTGESSEEETTLPAKVPRTTRTPGNKESKEENVSSGRVTRNKTSATPSQDTSSKSASTSRGRPSRSSTTVVPETDSSASSGRAAKQKEVEDTHLKVTPGNRKTKPEAAVSETRSGRRGRGSAQKDSQVIAGESLQSSTTSRSTTRASQVSTTSEDTTPVRRSGRAAILSQSTDSESERTPTPRRSARSSATKEVNKKRK